MLFLKIIQFLKITRRALSSTGFPFSKITILVIFTIQEKTFLAEFFAKVIFLGCMKTEIRYWIGLVVWIFSKCMTDHTFEKIGILSFTIVKTSIFAKSMSIFVTIYCRETSIYCRVNFTSRLRVNTKFFMRFWSS